MATSKIQRLPLGISYLGTDYYRNHIVDGNLTIDEDGKIETIVANGMCFLFMSGVSIAHTGSYTKILEGLPLALTTVVDRVIKGQTSDKTLQYYILNKSGSPSVDHDEIYINTYNMSDGDSLGTFTFVYPVK